MEIEGLKIIEPKRFGDERGFFCEHYDVRDLDIEFVQDKFSYNKYKGTVRGLHFQTEPMAQDKLVSVMRGSLIDVAVDLRQGSKTYGQHMAVELSFDNGLKFLVPKGFAHGFCTLEDDTIICYKTSDYYSAEHDSNLLWNDPDLAIKWPVKNSDAVVSEKDQVAPRLKDLPKYFD